MHTILKIFGILSALDNRGYIQCELDLRVKDFENFWTIGYSAVNKDAQGSPYPATAQHTVGETRAAAQNIERILLNRNTMTCNISSKGILAALDCHTAVAKVIGIHLSGFVAWFLWRTAYLYKIPG